MACGELAHVASWQPRSESGHALSCQGLSYVHRYHESVCLLLYRARGELPEWCQCSQGRRKHVQSTHFSRPFMHNMTPDRTSRIHWTTGGSAAQALPADVAGRVAALTRADEELYRAGRQRFFADVARVERETGRRFLCSQLPAATALTR